MSAGRERALGPLGLGVVAGVVTAAMVVAWVVAQDGRKTGPDTYVSTFASTSRPFDVALATGDGQAFAAIATDPTLSRPDVYVTGAREAAYRAQRPLAGYAAWVLSLGRPRLVGPALAALYVVGQVAAVAAAAALLGRRGARRELALIVVVLPPSLSALLWFGPEPVGLAFALGGVLLWERRTPGSAWGAAALFALSGLTRESNLAVPLGLGLAGLLGRTRPFSDLVKLAVAPAAWAAWAVVVRARLGWWPWATGACRVSETPFGGLGTGADHWPSPPVGEVGLIVVLAVVVSACLLWRRGDDLTWVVVVLAVLAAFLGDCVWRRWEDFSRPLLPLYALGLLALASPGRPRPGVSGDRQVAPSPVRR